MEIFGASRSALPPLLQSSQGAPHLWWKEKRVDRRVGGIVYLLGLKYGVTMGGKGYLSKELWDFNAN